MTAFITGRSGKDDVCVRMKGNSYQSTTNTCMYTAYQLVLYKVYGIYYRKHVIIQYTHVYARGVYVHAHVFICAHS